MPVPLRLIADVPPVEEVLTMVSDPVAAPAVVGSKTRFKVVDEPGFKVTGNVTPDIENPVPVSVAELIVTAPVPEEVNVTV
jgi:hypothetical protein